MLFQRRNYVNQLFGNNKFYLYKRPHFRIWKPCIIKPYAFGYINFMPFTVYKDFIPLVSMVGIYRHFTEYIQPYHYAAVRKGKTATNAFVIFVQIIEVCVQVIVISVVMHHVFVNIFCLFFSGLSKLLWKQAIQIQLLYQVFSWHYVWTTFT